MTEIVPCQGVTRGYLRYLRIQGIGFRAALKDQTLTLKLGYSHDVSYTLPPTLRAILPEPTLVGIYGIDKYLVGLAPTWWQHGKNHRIALKVTKMTEAARPSHICMWT